jgi:hypothetical protein
MRRNAFSGAIIFATRTSRRTAELASQGSSWSVGKILRNTAPF